MPADVLDQLGLEQTRLNRYIVYIYSDDLQSCCPAKMMTAL